MKKKINELLAYPRLKIVQDDDAFKFSIDSLILGSFVKCSDASKIIDLCSGNAPVAMYLTLKTNAMIYAVEIQKDAYEMALESISMNDLDNQVVAYNADLRRISKLGLEGICANTFDVVCANPPFFKASRTSHKCESITKTIARHEVECTMCDIIKEARSLLKDGGALYLVYKPDRLDEELETLHNFNFGIKDIRFVYPKVGTNAELVLVEAKKNRGNNIKVLEPLYINDENNYTKEVLDIFYLGKEE